jgi:hypothetical protein
MNLLRLVGNAAKKTMISIADIRLRHGMVRLKSVDPQRGQCSFCDPVASFNSSSSVPAW